MEDISKVSKLSTTGLLFLLIPILNIVGFILIFMGMKDLSEQYKDKRIYRNAFIGMIFGIISIIVLDTRILGFFALLLIGNAQQVISLLVFPSWLWAIILFSFVSSMAVFFRKALYALAKYSGVQLFRPAGTLLLIGGIVPILCYSLSLLGLLLNLFIGSIVLQMLSLFISLFLICVAYIMLVFAFFSLKRAPLNDSPSNAKTKYCMRCGTSIVYESAFCVNCGDQVN